MQRLSNLLRIMQTHGKALPLAIFDRATNKSRIAVNQDYWRNLKDAHKGQRGFVIGNGPSLKMEDLDRLQDEITIASNKIYLAFEKTDWRPTYFTVCDALVWKKIKGEVHRFITNVHAASYLFGTPLKLRKRVRFWKFLHPRDSQGELHFSKDLERGAFGGGTVTFENLQIAVHLGLNPIYIIGCDHFYSGEGEVKQDEAIVAGEVSNHFIKGYRKAGEKVNPAPVDEMNVGYARAREFADKEGIKIYNATRGGYLEAFERANFDELFSN